MCGIELSFWIPLRCLIPVFRFTVAYRQQKPTSILACVPL